MVRVLYFVDRLLWGGIQSLCYDIISHMDASEVTIDLLTLDDGQLYELESTLKNMGIQVFKLKGVWLRKPTDFIAYLKALRKFFQEHPCYDAVHLNSSSKNVFVLYYAKKAGIPVRIAHSHSIDYSSNNMLWKVVGDVLKYPLRKVATHYLACSQIAGEWLFGKSAVKNGKVKIVKNAIAVDDFTFHQEWRDQLRKDLHIENKFVIGCIGRFVPLKNHQFLIHIIYELKKKEENVCLLLIGTGVLEEELRGRVKSLGLGDNVIFLGFRTDRNKWLSAMDAFVLTSSFEGLGIVLIEAQAAALPTFAPLHVVPIEAKISSLLSFVSLEESPETWADRILKGRGRERLNMTECVRKAGYDMNQVIKEIKKLYSGK